MAHREPPKGSILIVEDEVVIAEDLGSRLIEMGYTVSGQATSAGQAFELAETQRPDLVLMDIVLKGKMDGIEAAEVIRDKWGLPVVFLTAHADTDRLERAKLTYPFGYLLKPIQDRDLRITVEMAMYVAEVDRERRAAEAALQESERIKSLVLNSTREMFAYYDLELRVRWCNEESGQSVGQTAEELIGRHCYEIWHQRSGPCEECPVLRALETGRAQEGEMETPDGNIWHVRGYPVFDESGAIVGLAEFGRNITERKRAENALKASEEKFRLIAESSAEDIWQLDLGGRVTYVSPAVEKLFGYSPEEAILLNFKSFFPESELEKATEAFIKAVGGLDSQLLEFTGRKKDGSTFFMEVSVTPIQKDKITIGVQGIARDITERKLIEKELKRERDLNARVMETSPAGITLVDANGRMVYANKRAEQILGIRLSGNQERTYDDPAWKITGFDGGPLPKTSLPFYMVKHGGKPVFGVQHAIEWPDGRRVLLSINAAPLFDSSGAFEGMVATIDDITDEWRAMAALRESEAFLNSLIDAIPVPVFYKDRDGRYLGFNRAFETFFGETKEGLIGKSVFDINPPDLAAIYQAKDAELFKNGGVQQYESQVKNANAVLRDVIFSKSVFTDGQGAVKGLIGAILDITERKKAENALLEGEAAMRAILNATSDAAFLIDADGMVLALNKEAAKRLGVKAEEIIGQCMYDYLPSDVAQARRARVGEVVESGKPLRFEDRHGDRYLSNSVYPVFDSQNRVTRLAIFGTDITEERRATEEMKFQVMLLSQIQDHITATDTQGNIVYVNDAQVRTFKRSREELLGQPVSIFGQDPSRGATQEQIVHSTLADGAWRGEVVNYAGDGREIIMECRTTLIKDPAGRPVSMVGIATDITERKQAEERLKESEERYRSLFTSTNDGVCLHEIVYEGEKAVDYRILDINPKYQSLTGIGRNEAIDALASKLYGTGEPPYLDIYARVAETGKPTSLEIFFQPIDKHLLISVYSPGPGKFATVFQDISMRKRAEEEKARLESELLQARKMEAIGTLAGGVAHDFNNLLQAINGYTQLLMMNKPKTDPDRPYLKEIELASGRAGQLVRQLLLFSRKAETERLPINLNEEVDRARRLLERTIPKMIDIELHPGRDLWAVPADPVQMEQTLLNLGVNAADSMPDGGRLVIETRNISLDGEDALNLPGVSPGRYVLLVVSDTGFGMDPETLEHIFDPFFTTKEFGKGTGLGLASVYGIVKAHGGHIACHSEPGLGTTFRIYLPAMETGEPGALSLESEAPPPGGTETILLVDDEAPIRTFAAQVLEHFGYQVLTAANGREALEIYAGLQSRIDLVVLDIGMPVMGGHQCLMELRKADPSARVLMASGYSVEGHARKALESGAAGYVSKPYQINDLLLKVRAALDGKP